jgi:hypothetical protein
MRTKVTLVLLFLNVALFFFIFKFEGSWRTERASLEARRRVLGAEAADIRTLSVTSTAPGGSFALSRRGANWFLTTPLDWPANVHAVNRILGELKLLEHDASFEVAALKNNGQSLADYGLDKPRLTLAFNSGDATGDVSSRTTTILIGDTTPDGNRLYLLSADGERVHVVPRAVAESLTLPIDQLRNDGILSIPVYEARGLRLVRTSTASTGTAAVVLHRDGAREVAHWSFDTPIVARASKNATELTLNSLFSLRAKTFLTDNPPGALPSAAPTLRVTVEGNNRRETLLLGEPVPPASLKPETQNSKPGAAAAPASTEYYAQLEGRTALFTVVIEETLQATLLNAQKELRETLLLEFEPRSVTAITINAPNQPPLILQRDLAANSADTAPWQVVRRSENSPAPQTRPADRAAVQRLLEQLALLTVQKFSSDAPTAAELENWGFNRPEREITLSLAGPRPAGTPLSPASRPGENPATANSQITLKVGLATQRDNLAYAQLVGPVPSVYAVSPDILRETPTAFRAWRDRLVRELPGPVRISALKLTDLANNTVLAEVAFDASGNLPAETPNAKPLTELAAALRVLRAKSFVQDNFTETMFIRGEERAWRFRLDTTIVLPAGAANAQTTTSTLLFTERSGGAQQIAGSRESDLVFEIEQPLVDALWAITYGPRDPSAVTK